MKKTVMQKWVRALRSGKYKQGVGALAQDGCNCALGVLCEIAALDKAVIKRPAKASTDMVGYDGEFWLLPQSVRVYAGIRTPSAFSNKLKKSVSELNDGDRWSFRKIAAWIEKNYRQL